MTRPWREVRAEARAHLREARRMAREKVREARHASRLEHFRMHAEHFHRHWLDHLLRDETMDQAVVFTAGSSCGSAPRSSSRPGS